MAHEGVGGEERCLMGFDGRPDGERPLGRLKLDGRIILKWLLQ